MEQPLASPDSAVTPTSGRGQCLVAFTSIVLALQAALFTGSYIAPWSDTIIRWNDNDGATNVIYSTNVWESVQNFAKSGATGVLVLMIVFLFAVPTLAWLILQPILIGILYSGYSGKSSCGTFGRSQFPAIHSFVELSWKVVAFAVFLQAIFLAGTSTTLTLGGFNVDLVTVARGGLAAFAWAILFGMLFSALARVHYKDSVSQSATSVDEDAFVMMEDQASDDNRCCGLPRLLKPVIVFVSGLIATVLLIPVYLLPVIQLTYDGVVADLLESAEKESTLFQLATSIATDSLGKVFGILCAAMLWITIILLPFVALMTSLYLRLCGSWKDNALRGSKLFHALQLVFPFCSSAVFAISLVVAILAMGTFTSYFFNENQVCQFLNQQADEYCFIVYGAFEPATWGFLMQSIATEVFAFLTLRDIENLPLSKNIVNDTEAKAKGILS